MKKYIKPQIRTEEFEVIDIITNSTSFFDNIADFEKSSSIYWDDDFFDPKDSF